MSHPTVLPFRPRPARSVAPPPPADGPATVALQARPIRTRVSHYPSAVGVITAIYREWSPGDTARCRLCASCRAYHDGCLFTVGQYVAEADAPGFSTHGLNWLPDPSESGGSTR